MRESRNDGRKGFTICYRCSYFARESVLCDEQFSFLVITELENHIRLVGQGTVNERHDLTSGLFIDILVIHPRGQHKVELIGEADVIDNGVA